MKLDDSIFPIGKQRIILILLAGYVVIVAALTIYHANNFTHYIHIKGEETTVYMDFLLSTSILFQILIWIIARSLNWKAAILSTVVNFVFSVIIGFIILYVFGITGIPRHLIFLYGTCYMIFFSMVTVWQTTRLKTA